MGWGACCLANIYWTRIGATNCNYGRSNRTARSCINTYRPIGAASDSIATLKGEQPASARSKSRSARNGYGTTGHISTSTGATTNRYLRAGSAGRRRVVSWLHRNNPRSPCNGACLNRQRSGISRPQDCRWPKAGIAAIGIIIACWLHT